MMPRKKRRTILILSIALVICILIVSLLLIYINTDMFQSKSTLFTKYLGQNLDNMENFYQQIGTNPYEEVLKQNKYTTEMQAKINYTENIGTSSESMQNSVNQLKWKMQGQTDKTNQYKAQDIQMLNNDETVAKVKYIQKGNTYGIQFSDLLSQYLVVENENLKELFEKLGYSDEEIAKIPDKIEQNNELGNIANLSEQEKQNMKNKYIRIITNNISKDNFSKQKNQTIQMNGKNIKANCYTVTMTKEQLNNIYLKMLEEIKQEEIILTRIDSLQALLEQYQLITPETNFRNQFVQQIEDYIAQINRNNIGNEETKIMVYETNGTTVSTMIQTTNYEIYIDLLTQQENPYMQIAYKDHTTGKEQENVLTYQKTAQKTNMAFEWKKDGKTKQYRIESDEKVQGDHYTKNTVAKYEDGTNRVEWICDQEIELVNHFEQEVVLDENNSMNLSKMEEEQAKEIVEKVSVGVAKKIEEIMTTTIHLEDVGEVLKAIGMIKEEQILQSMQVTQTERNRFNSQFEILQGENLENTDIIRIIDAIQQNLNDMEVVSNTELRLKLDRLENNEELVTTIRSFIEQNRGKKYHVKVEYNETTGLVEYIRLTMLER